MKKTKLIALFLAAIMMLSVFAACGNDNSDGSTPANDSSTASSEGTSDSTPESSDAGAETGEAYDLTMALIGNEQPRQEEIWAKVQEMAKQNMNINLDYLLLGFGDYSDRLNLMLAGGDKLDILPMTAANAATYINAGQIVNLRDYIYDHGQDIISFMTEDVATSGAIGDFIWGIPANKESASKAGIVMRKDIVDELKIDVDSIKTMNDLAPIFAQVKEAHPELDAISGTNLLSQMQMHDPLSDGFGVLMMTDYKNLSTEVVNLYETEEWISRAKLVHDWYQSGYVKLDAATSTDTSSNLVKAGSLFSYLSPIKPGFLAQENVVCGQEMVTAFIGLEDGSESNVICTNNVNFFDWGIAQQSEDKVKAMQFLNYAYSSAEWNNLMNFGEQGVDYDFMDGSSIMIDYPEGADASSTYHFNMGWMLPNQFLGYVWNGNPEDVWQQYQDFNASAQYSVAFGFLPDTSSLSTELTALNSVYSEYYNAIATGSVSDVDATVAEFNQKLYGAGLQEMMDLKQQQLNDWLASRG